jgi:hypothetical protein
MENKQFLLDAFNDDLFDTTWLLDKDAVYATKYFELSSELQQANTIENDAAEEYIEEIYALKHFYYDRAKNSSDWVTPKKRAANELLHDEDGNLTPESVELLKNAIVDEASEKTLISDTGKTISFGDKWHQMINSCSFKAVAVDRLTDFVSKFTEADGWSKYFVGNIGKNNKRLIQEYHPMDKYNLDHNTKYAAMHLGGNTTRSVLVSVDTGTRDGRGEPSSITFLEIGAHTIIDRFIVGSFNVKRGKPITEATTEDLAKLLGIE